MNIKKVKTGIIGAGRISGTYLDNLCRRFEITEVVGICDADPEKAEKAAAKYGIRVMTMEEMLSDPEIELVVNLTTITSHYAVTKEALLHGKHVYTEKMLASSLAEGKELLALSGERGLMLGVAPDTFMGGGIQTIRKLLDDRTYGIPMAVNAAVVRGYRTDSPFSREGMYAKGATLPYDMAGYYLHAMFCLFGGVKRVAAFTSADARKFTHPANPHYGDTVVPESATRMAISLEFESGVLGTLLLFDQGIQELNAEGYEPGFSVYCTKGTIRVPDPNTYGGPVEVITRASWHTVPLSHGLSGEREHRSEPVRDPADFFAASRRGAAAADMAWALRTGRKPHNPGSIGLHALEVIEGAEISMKTGKAYEMTTKIERPEALRPGFFSPSDEAVFDEREL